MAARSFSTLFFRWDTEIEVGIGLMVDISILSSPLVLSSSCSGKLVLYSPEFGDLMGDLYSFFMLSLTHPGQFYQVILSQGFAMGIGTGMTFMPTTSVLAHHFRRRRGLAMGIITTGGAVGAFFFSSVLGQFFAPDSKIGFAWGIRICAFVSLACMVLANVLMRTNYPSKSEPSPRSSVGAETGIEEESQSLRELVFTTLKNKRFQLMMLFGFFFAVSVYNPIFALQIFATEQPGVDDEVARWLISIMNLVSVLGRMIPNALADRYGMLEVYIPCVGAAGVVGLIMFVCTKTGGAIVFAIL